MVKFQSVITFEEYKFTKSEKKNLAGLMRANLEDLIK